MLLRLTIATVLASLALRAGTTVTVYLDAPQPPAAETQNAMSREFDTLTAGLGLDVHWQSYRNRDSSPQSEYLFVVTLRGSCNDYRKSGAVRAGEARHRFRPDGHAIAIGHALTGALQHAHAKAFRHLE